MQLIEVTVLWIIAVVISTRSAEAKCVLSIEDDIEKEVENITICYAENETICCPEKITKDGNVSAIHVNGCRDEETVANCSRNCSCIEATFGLCSHGNETCLCIDRCNPGLQQNCTNENCSTRNDLNCTGTDPAVCDVTVGYHRCLTFSAGGLCTQACLHNCTYLGQFRDICRCDNTTDHNETKQCSDWTNGLNCSGNCTCNEDNTIIYDHVGDMYNCSAGYYGENCTEVCPSGTYGKACANNCTCNNTSCNHVTGNCTCNGEDCMKDSKRPIDQDQVMSALAGVIVILIVVIILLPVTLGLFIRYWAKKKDNSGIDMLAVFDNPAYDANSEKVTIDKIRKSTVKHKKEEEVTFIRFSLTDENDEEVASVEETNHSRRPSNKSKEIPEGDGKTEEEHENKAAEASRELSANQNLYSTADMGEPYSDQDLYNVLNEKTENPSSNNIYNTFSEVRESETVLGRVEETNDYDVVERETIKLPDTENYSTFDDVRKTFKKKGWITPPSFKTTARRDRGNVYSFATDNFSDRSHFSYSKERVKSMINVSSVEKKIKPLPARFSANLRKSTPDFLSDSHDDMKSKGFVIYDECASETDVRKAKSESDILNNTENAFHVQAVNKAYEENEYDVVDRDLIKNIPPDIDDYSTFSSALTSGHTKYEVGNDKNVVKKNSNVTDPEMLVISNENENGGAAESRGVGLKQKKKRKKQKSKKVNTYENVTPIPVLDKNDKVISDSAAHSKTDNLELEYSNESSTQLKPKKLKSMERRKIDYEEFKLNFT